MKWLPAFMLLLGIAAHAQWDTLFFSPAERLAIEQVASPPKARTYRFDGEIRNGSGHRIAHWVNGSRQDAPSPPENILPAERWTEKADHTAGKP